jgi:hypothetical protein
MLTSARTHGSRACNELCVVSSSAGGVERDRAGEPSLRNDALDGTRARATRSASVEESCNDLQAVGGAAVLP